MFAPTRHLALFKIGPATMFDQIEKLKTEFTDKFVVVDEGQPELLRFKGKTGQIKTVNMSGRALVQFDGDNNIGWFDIGLDFLKVVPAPAPKPEDDKHGKKSAKPQTSADSPAVAPKPVGAAEKAASDKPAGEKKMSVAEMLRAQAAAKAAGGAPATSEKPAAPAAKPAAPATAAPVAAEPAPPKVEAPAKAPAAEQPVVEKPAAASPEAPTPAGEQRKLTTAEILAQLRKKP